jgi:hypothetical protein
LRQIDPATDLPQGEHQAQGAAAFPAGISMPRESSNKDPATAALVCKIEENLCLALNLKMKFKCLVLYTL